MTTSDVLELRLVVRNIQEYAYNSIRQTLAIDADNMDEVKKSLARVSDIELRSRMAVSAIERFIEVCHTDL